MNSVFNIKRFWWYLKREMVFDHKLLFQIMSVTFVALLAYVLFSKVLGYESVSGFIAGLLFGLGVICVGYFTSEISSCFKKKPICVDYLTVPASMLEKYLTKIIKHFLIPFLVYMIALRICQFIEDSNHVLFEFTRMDMLLTGILLLESAYLLFFGVFFRRFAIVWALVFNTVVSTVFGACALFINFMSIDPIRVYLQMHGGSRLELFAASSAVIMIISIIVSYFIYRRKELHVKPLNW